MNKNYQKDDLSVIKIPTEVKGYRVQDVDTILDNVAVDYEQYDQEIATLKAEIAELKLINAKLEADWNQLSKASKDKMTHSMDEIRNNLASPDIIKRISAIEQAIISINEKLTKA